MKFNANVLILIVFLNSFWKMPRIERKVPLILWLVLFGLSGGLYGVSLGAAMVADESDLLIYSLVAFGGSNILAKTKICKFLREDRDGVIRRNWLSQVLSCPACNGFWLGVLFYSIGWHLIGISPIVNGFLQGLLTSAICWIVFALVDCTGAYDRH
jgi:hypothetical protein